MLVLLGLSSSPSLALDDKKDEEVIKEFVSLIKKAVSEENKRKQFVGSVEKCQKKEQSVELLAILEKELSDARKKQELSKYLVSCRVGAEKTFLKRITYHKNNVYNF